ncbi:hypothetical protein [Pseudomonas syringae group genomosp. 3]|uniref:Uncharacterized protein n=1 Tax=Pseudomonas syringae pv. coriandricola TaxID=264453 RepID=A0A3M3JSV1_9PSED|nr:hypothetical protein [Pseudomonas syringae group genomosp. 3]RMN13950.1 hypothetical protein ALQ65_200127 [Pseudomonas syringae pv. coriandricola]
MSVKTQDAATLDRAADLYYAQQQSRLWPTGVTRFTLLLSNDRNHYA